MFGVFGAGLAGTVMMCILAVLVGFIIPMLGAAFTDADGDDPFVITLIIMAGIVLGGFGCTYVISQPDGYVGEAKYVENVMNYEGGSGTAVPIVEVEGKGRFPMEDAGIVSYEIGDMVPVQCYYDTCEVGSK